MQHLSLLNIERRLNAAGNDEEEILACAVKLKHELEKFLRASLHHFIHVD